jgi:hypothetical protein
MADSDEEWARTLCRVASSAQLDDASDDEFLRSLCRASPGSASALAESSVVPILPLAESSVAVPIWPASAESSIAVSILPAFAMSSVVVPIVPLAVRPIWPARAKYADVPVLLDWRDRKRRKLHALVPPTVIETRSLVHQHVQTMTLMASCSRIHASLIRSWLSCSANDCGPVSLRDLANSLVARVRGLCCDTTPPSIFKIGLTRDPRWRFHDAPFAYAIDDEYDSMEVDHCRLAAKNPEERIG